MINYIFEVISFCGAFIMYCRDEIDSMAIWLAAAVMFGFAGALVEIFFSRKRSHKEVKNG